MIQLTNITFAFKKNRPLFSGLNLELKPGRTYGLFGLNGAGKTTLLNHISGMLFPAKGECLIFGKPSRNRLPETMSELIVLPEQFDLPPVHADRYTALHAPFYPNFDETQLITILEEFEIDRQKKLTELSYGQRKKFLIAFGLAANTRILLMDEPTNGLDIPSKSQFRKVMAGTSHDERCTVISTHQVRDLNTMIDQITVLNNGTIIFDQSLDAISAKLSFEKIPDNQSWRALYSEEIFGGKAAILPKNSGSEETQVDLELLFNGIIKEPGSINHAFSN